MEFGIAGVAAITVIAYTVGLLVKASGLNNKWIPVICVSTWNKSVICGVMC